MRPADLPNVVDAASFVAATNVSRETIERLNLYESVLKLWQPRINLVANATLPGLWSRHFLDSAQILPLIPQEAATLVDLGSGAGFPGLVLAILLADRRASDRPIVKNGHGSGREGQGFGHPIDTPVATMHTAGRGVSRFVLVESDQRKCAFMREVARQTGVAVEILSTRIENPETHAKVGTADVVTARALAPLEQLFTWALPMFGPETVGLFLKGRNAATEVEAARAKWVFDARLVPSVTAADSSVVVVRRLGRRFLSGA